jgi:hypothetical protein
VVVRQNIHIRVIHRKFALLQSTEAHGFGSGEKKRANKQTNELIVVELQALLHDLR